MATFGGVVVAFVAVGNPVGVSTNLDDFTGPFTTPSHLATAAVASSDPAAPAPLEFLGVGPLGGVVDEFGGLTFFERVHVYPRSYPAGFVISAIEFDAEVWNAYRASTLTLDTITPPSGQGITVDDPYGLPATFRPLRSRIYEVRIGTVGAPIIDGSIVWDFSGVVEPGLPITGTRVVPFLLEPDWNEPFEETTEYLTDVIAAEDGTEQRFGLRETPRRTLRFRVLTIESARHTATLDQLLEGNGAYQFGIPLWPNAARVTTNVSLGGTTIVCDPTSREFTVGGLAILFRDPWTWEVVTVEAVGGASLTVTATAAAWPKDVTRVIPIVFGRITERLSLGRVHRALEEGQVEFLIPGVQ